MSKDEYTEELENNISQYEDNEEEIDDNNDENTSKNKDLFENEKHELGGGNGCLHYLPAKINFNGPCKVGPFFETLIENKKNNFVTSLRGRILKGKKKECEGKYNLFHTRLIKNFKNKISVNKVNKINEFYIWKFDEEVSNQHNLNNIENILTNFNVLS